MATTARKTTAAKKTTAARKPAAATPDETPTPATAPVEEPKVEEVTAPAETSGGADSAADAPAPASDPATEAPKDEAPVESPAIESDPTSDEADAPAAEAADEPEADGVADGGEGTVTVTRENAAEVIGRAAIAASGDVPGAASEHPDTGTAVREAPDLQHAPLEAPKPVEAPAQPVAADTQFADVATTLLAAGQDSWIVDEATGLAPVAPLFTDATFGVVTSRYRLIEQVELAGRTTSRLLVAKDARLSAPAAARIEAYVLDANADED